MHWIEHKWLQNIHIEEIVDDIAERKPHQKGLFQWFGHLSRKEIPYR
jgi:hypothetical protein